ncbi:hypothetical protein SEA_BLAB_80 [Microbacterium phage Blab]|nr:hypothetical protein SEA_BLAB_80 [Microbacterium phage Blab]
MSTETEAVVELAVVKPLTLSVSLTREIDPQEIEDMIFGTGMLTWSWWRRTPEKQIREGATGYLMRFVCPDDSGKNATFIPLQRIVDAAAKYLSTRSPLDGDETSARDDSLGYFDALGADNVMQIAVFGEVIYA